jgi:hypothetical protein
LEFIDSGDARWARSWARAAANDPELAKLIDAWADLPQAIRAGIIAMIDAARGDS